MTVPDLPETDAEVAGFVRELGLPGIVDLHVHFLPPTLQRAVWDYFDRLEDPPWPVVYREPEPRRLQTLEELGVVRHTALAYAHKPGMSRWLNDHTLGLAEEDDRVIPTFTFHPDDGPGEIVEEALARGGAVAKIHLQVGRFRAADPRLDVAWELLVDEGVPVVLHAGAVYGVDGGERWCGADEVRALLERHPGLTVVVAHLGAPDFEDFLALAEEFTTLRMDTAMVLTDPPYLRELPIALLPRLRAMTDRVLFGSDFPTIPHAYAAQVRGLGRLELDEEGWRDILYRNATDLMATAE